MSAARTLWRVRQAIQRPGWAARIAWNEVQGRLFFDARYRSLREPKCLGAWTHDRSEYDRIEADLSARGIAVERRTIDREALERFRSAARYERWPSYYDGGRAPAIWQKVVEHFVAMELLDPHGGDVLIDVASQRSPAPAIYREIRACRVFRQDLAYAEGLHADRIGGDAAQMPVADGFADAISLHNAFEHFEGDADMRFVREVARVLKPGGRACIVPLFMSARYVVQTDPAVWPASGIPFEADALVCCARGWRDRHGRSYDVEHFITRIAAVAEGLSVRVISIPEAMALHPEVYLRFVLLLTRSAA